MKTLASILAGAVLAGLVTFFTFDQLRAFEVNGPYVVINIAVFVGFIAAIAILAATLAVGFRAAIRRGDERLVKRLEERIRALESADVTAPPAAATPPAAPIAPAPEPQA
ncbi:MAG: hypothetical protein NXI31_04885 [bacterium]|nr:hypothetical protein [bacterium]